MQETFFYHPEQGLKTDLTRDQMKDALQDPRALLWVDFSDIDDESIDVMTTLFNLHPLTVEDFIMPNARPKAEKFKEYLFLVMFTLEGQNGHAQGKPGLFELDSCLGRNFLITYHERPCASLAACKDRIKKLSPIIMNGADALLYAILDMCVDSYFPVIADFDNRVDQMSDELFKEPSQETLKRIYTLKNEVLHLRRTIGPQADVISLIVRGDYEFITPANLIYFRNIYDNLVRLNDIIGTSRDIITGALEAYVSVISNRLNEIMKTLTVIATIMMPLTLIASIYGMNFKNMPELEHRFGYPAVVASMVIICVVMLAFFKRKKWL